MKFKLTAQLISYLAGIFIGISIYILYKLIPRDSRDSRDSAKIIKENFETEQQSDSSLSATGNTSTIANDATSSNVIDDTLSNTSNTSNIGNIGNTSNTSNTSNIPSDNSTEPELTRLTQNNSQGNATIPELPAYDKNFMVLTTFNQGEKITNNEMKWYDNNIDIDSILKTDYNKGVYFTISNTTPLIDDKIIPLAKGANIQNVSLSGPAALYFANNTKDTFNISEFTIIFMIKLVSLSGNSTLFEVLCNTSVTDEYDDPVYIPQAISMNVIRKSANMVNIDIIFGSHKYTINDIDINVLVNDTIHLISLSYNSTNLFVIVDSNMYTFDLVVRENITLGPLPMVINKNGELNAVMYAFAYYKKALSTVEITSFQQYIHFNLSGITDTIKEAEEYKKMLQEARDNEKKNNNKLKNVSKLLDKCVVTKTEEDTVVDKREYHQKLYEPIPRIIAPVPSKM